MARHIARVPGHFSRAFFKSLSVIITFIVSLVTYATGQAPIAGSDGQPSTTPLKSFVSAMQSGPDDPVLEYGIQPLYGVVDYGMPYAKFAIKGHIRTSEAGEPIEQIQVTLQDTLTNIVHGTTYTDGNGAFAFDTVQSSPWNNTWILKAIDIDGTENGGLYDTTDTLVTIPLDSLEGGDGSFYEGVGEADITLFMKEHATAVVTPVADRPFVGRARVSSTGNGHGSTDIVYIMPGSGMMSMGLYDSRGRRIRTLTKGVKQPGRYSMRINTTQLGAGTYYVKLRTGAHAAVTAFSVVK
jgi:putative lipoprotein (rSAM/lipoprotein system)